MIILNLKSIGSGIVIMVSESAGPRDLSSVTIHSEACMDAARKTLSSVLVDRVVMTVGPMPAKAVSWICSGGELADVRGVVSWMVRDAPQGPWSELIDLEALMPSDRPLATYAARLGMPPLIDPEEGADQSEWRDLMTKEAEVVRQLIPHLRTEIDLRREIEAEHGVRCMGMTRPQIAEAVMRVAGGMSGHRPRDNVRYRAPRQLSFESDDLSRIVSDLESAEYRVRGGVITPPDCLMGREVVIGSTTYRMGLGGLHSRDPARVIRCAPDEVLEMVDASSYYPALILGMGIEPPGMWGTFSETYRPAYEGRLRDKAEGKPSEGKKVIINSAFGKLNQKSSILYCPESFLRVCLTGQLALLMLIESLESEGASVLSANTDGILVRYNRGLSGQVSERLRQWASGWSLGLGRSSLSIYAQKDISNYFAVNKDGGVDMGGCFSTSLMGGRPDHPAVFRAVILSITEGAHPAATIAAAAPEDLCSVRQSAGGISGPDGRRLGRSVRMYRARDCEDHLVDSVSGRRIPGSAGCMVHESGPLQGVDMLHYLREAQKLIDLMEGGGS